MHYRNKRYVNENNFPNLSFNLILWHVSQELSLAFFNYGFLFNLENYH